MCGVHSSSVRRSTSGPARRNAILTSCVQLNNLKMDLERVFLPASSRQQMQTACSRLLLHASVCVCSFLEGSERNAIVLLTDVCVAGNQSGDAWLQPDYGHRPSKFCGAASCTNRGSSNQFYPTQVHLHRTCMRQQMNYWYISSSCLLSIAFC
jgi:hypothetical protein